MKKDQNIALFNQKTVRRHWDDDKELWYFSVIDVIAVLTNSTIPRRYWTDLKSKLQHEGSEVYEKIVQLKLISPEVIGASMFLGKGNNEAGYFVY